MLLPCGVLRPAAFVSARGDFGLTLIINGTDGGAELHANRDDRALRREAQSPESRATVNLIPVNQPRFFLFARPACPPCIH